MSGERRGMKCERKVEDVRMEGGGEGRRMRGSCRISGWWGRRMKNRRRLYGRRMFSYTFVFLSPGTESLTRNNLDVQEVTQSEAGQRQKLSIVLNAANHVSK